MSAHAVTVTVKLEDALRRLVEEEPKVEIEWCALWPGEVYPDDNYTRATREQAEALARSGNGKGRVFWRARTEWSAAK